MSLSSAKRAAEALCKKLEEELPEHAARVQHQVARAHRAAEDAVEALEAAEADALVQVL